MTLENGDACKLEMWVLFSPVGGMNTAPAVGKVVEILQCNTTQNYLQGRPDAVLLQEAEIGQAVLPDFYMPKVQIMNTTALVPFAVSI